MTPGQTRNSRLAVVLILLSAMVAGSASPATFTVTKTTDTNDGICNADCSLREAVIAANANGLVDTIILPAGTYLLAIPGQVEDAAATGDLDITEEVTIAGAGARSTIVDAGALDRVIELHPSAGSVSIIDLAIRNGLTSGGAGIRNDEATLTVVRCAIVDNVSSSNGGGFQGIGTALILESTLQGNVAVRGGGLDVSGGTMTVVNSTISGNMATDFGGGIRSSGSSTVVDLRNVTISANIADSDDDGFGNAGGIAIDGSSSVEVTHTIVGGNLDLGGEVPDCLSDSNNQLISGGYNFIGNTTSCVPFGDETGNLYNLDPLLSPLSANGGPTDTHALQAGSLAIDAGNPAGCLDEHDMSLTVDQRGELRPSDGDGDTVAVCDMGAFERGDLIFDDGFESGDTSAWSATLP